MSVNPAGIAAVEGEAAGGVAAFSATAIEMAALARRIALRYFRHPLTVEHKIDDSPVTIADRDIESALRRLLRERHPSHGIFGEEHGRERLGGRFTWVIDPIDGTKSFITGMPLFGTLIALLDDGKPITGVIDMPVLNETWLGRWGQPTELNGSPCRTSGRTELADCVLYATSPDTFDDATRPAFERVSRQVRLRRFGGDCYAYALVASGHIDLVVEAGLQPYDYLPLVNIIEGSGGVITDWTGRKLGLDSDGKVVAAASPALHDRTLELIARTS
jgi:inositol-phosphate phosphatase/L-galactose 1-phosphate phosphatase/histidinol-phosphatase